MLDSIEETSSCFRRRATPLLKKEGDPLLLAAVPHIDDPLGLHGPGLWAAFPTDNDPGDALEVQIPYGTEQRFDGKKACGDGSLLEMLDPGGRRVVFNRYATPDMPWDRT